MIIKLGLLIIPFFVIAGYDTRYPKFILALTIAFIIGLMGIYKREVSCRNIPFLLLLFYISLTAFNQLRVLYVLVFSLMAFSIQFKREYLETMVWAGFIMSLYAILQAFKIDPLFMPSGLSPPQFQPHIIGFLGHPIILASFLVPIVPLALYLKRYCKAVVMIVVILITLSHISIGAMIVVLLFLLWFKNKKLAIMGFVLFIIGAYFLYDDSGRSSIWLEVLKDWWCVPWFGYGFGAFSKLFTFKGITEIYAHNEYLQLLYSTGIVGLLLFLGGIAWLVIGKITRERKYLLASLLGILLCSFGIFNLQLGHSIFYACVIGGMLNERIVE